MSVGDEAFNRLVSPHLDELLDAARRELRYRVALGELRPDDLSPEELVGETLAPVSLEAKPPPDPFYDDDESFWEWYQPDEMTRWEDVVAERASLTPEEVVESEERLRSLAPRERLVYVLHDIHRHAARTKA